MPDVNRLYFTLMILPHVKRLAMALVGLPVPLAAAPFAPPIQYHTGHVPEVMALGDLDRDGILDVVVANTSATEDVVAGDVTVFLGLEGGGLRRLGEWKAK